ncbi:MAG: fasciclin domain-containing protein [Chitinophagaceae bacterium]|jgi:uncharacterized surface protein with fasciclin (FAS1) repeats|nr:fasciclin domain-containing protein [Chitinophagaceae bacterium]
MIRKSFAAILLLASVSVVNLKAGAQSKDIVDIAVGSSAHTTLVAAVKAADLVSTLKGTGPFTVFAPTNDAFSALPSGTVESLLKAENKGKLSSVLTYHVVPGNIVAKDVVEAINKGNGKAVVTTVQGGKLTLTLDGSKVKITDENGRSAYVTAVDLKGSNGVIHVIDTVVLPK